MYRTNARQIISLFFAIYLFAATALAACIIFPQDAEAGTEWPKGIKADSKSAVVMEQKSGAVLLSKDEHKERFPASITKIMTALIAIESCELDEKVRFSKDAVYLNEGDTSNISRDVGEKMTMEQCLYGMMLESANECAWAIGEHVAGGNIKDFVKMMNARAEELGCRNTHFANPNGLPDDDHYTSAYDMALISRAAYSNKTFATICGTRSYTIPPTNKHKDPTPLNNHHAMLGYYKTGAYIYDGCLGGKTGYTVAAGNTLVTYAKKNGMTLVCVVMNAPSGAHYTDTTRLFDYCFSKFVTYSVAETESLSEMTKKNAGSLDDGTDLLSIDEDALLVLPKGVSALDARASVEPSDDGENVVGEISFSYADHYVGGGKLLYREDQGNVYPFSNIAGNDDKDVIIIDYYVIGMSVLTIAVAVALEVIWGRISPFIYEARLRKRSEREANKRRYTRLRDNSRRGRRRR